MAAPKDEYVSAPLFPALIFDIEKLNLFFRQLALARAISATTEFKWEKANNTTLNVLYGLKYALTLGNAAGPGYMAMTGASSKELREMTERQLPGLRKSWAEKAKQGPQQLIPWMEKLEQERQQHKKDLLKLQLEARRTNEEVDRLIGEAIFYIASVKFASELALATLGMMPFGGVAGVFLRLGVGLGYPIFLNMLSIADGRQASVVGTLTTTVATGVKAAGENASSFVGEGEGPIMKGVEAGTVNKSKDEIAKLKARKLKHGNLSKANQAKMRAEKAKIKVGRANMAVLGTVASGVSVYFFYKSCEGSAEAYWEALESN
jgi:hypothetical protein